MTSNCCGEVPFNRCRAFNIPKAKSQVRIISGGATGWWEVMTLVEHPEYADQDAIG